MDRFRNYDIAFSGLKTGKHDFKFEINQEFFDLFETEQEFFNPKIDVNVHLDKHTTFLEFYINVSGTVQLICDISNDEFSENIENDLKVLVKFGEEYDDSNEDIIRNRIKEYYTKTAEVAELYKKQGKYIEVNGVGEIEEISNKLFAEVDKIK